VVAAVALLAPLLVGLTGLRVPEVVLQILLGVLVGPQLLGWARVDEPVAVLAMLGLGFLLLLAGLEIEFERLRGQVLVLTSVAFAVSFALALVVGFGLGAAGLVRSPLLVAVILSATSLGIILPLLKDSGAVGTPRSGCGVP
jgi:Kef-type K+ transport system membrane component KefB